MFRDHVGMCKATEQKRIAHSVSATVPATRNARTGFDQLGILKVVARSSVTDGATGPSKTFDDHLSTSTKHVEGDASTPMRHERSGVPLNILVRLLTKPPQEIPRLGGEPTVLCNDERVERASIGAKEFLVVLRLALGDERHRCPSLLLLVGTIRHAPRNDNSQIKQTPVTRVPDNFDIRSGHIVGVRPRLEEVRRFMMGVGDPAGTHRMPQALNGLLMTINSTRIRPIVDGAGSAAIGRDVLVRADACMMTATGQDMTTDADHR